ncbi:MAG TPA: hypothetical protein VL326_31320 [Kofleriaceae bacterium]|nr:hypothetical protein [Kofleriaceae bacterium]
MGDRTRREHDTADAGDVQTTDAGETAATSHGMNFTSAGFIPPVMGWQQGESKDTASDIAFGVGRDGHVKKKPSKEEGDVKAIAQRQEAERLLKTKDVTSPQDAQQALEILLSVDDQHMGKVIDELDDKAFENMIDRLGDDQLARITMLVDASQKPKRKLQLWRVQHMARARNDLHRYEGTFGTEDDRTDEQQKQLDKYERRKKGVDSTAKEVDKESKKLLDKGDDLTVADIDKMRERKDKELEVEMKHNVNLVAQDGPRTYGMDNKIDDKNPDVVWSRQEIAQVDHALDKVPQRHGEDASSVATYERKANGYMNTKGGEYHKETQTIDIYDNASTELDSRGYVPPVEYSTVHEIGHEVETENQAAFKKFEKAAGWQTSTRTDLEKQGVSGDTLDEGKSHMHEQGKLIHKHFGEDKYDQVDDTAIPTHEETGNDRGTYSETNAQEHWAEMYAMAVETPQTLYEDYVQRPADNAKRLRAELKDLKGAALEQKKQELARAEKIVKQRRELFDIIRNDVFRAEKETAAAVARLEKKGVGADAIKAFKEKAPRVSTPQQIEELELEATKSR